MSSPMTKEEVEAGHWPCDFKLRSCRNPNGCHCREIADLHVRLAAHESLSAGAVVLQLPAEAVVERTFEYSTSTHKYKPIIKILLPDGVDSQDLWEGRDKIAGALNACRAAMQGGSKG